MFLYNYEGNINQVSSGSTSLKNVLMISEGIALKRKKVGPTVLNFFLYPFLPPVKQHAGCPNIAWTIISGHVLAAFWKDSKWRGTAP